MGVVFGVSIIFHVFLFVTALGFFWFTSKKENFSKRDWSLFFIMTLMCSLLNVSLVVFGLNKLPGLAGSQLALIGYTAFPVIPIALGLMSYPLFQFYNQKKSNPYKYSSVFWAIILSAPIGYGSIGMGTMMGVL